MTRHCQVLCLVGLLWPAATTARAEWLPIDTTRESEGQGLMSMRRRARRLGGAWEVASGSGQGTEVSVRIPVAPTYLGT